MSHRSPTLVFNLAEADATTVERVRWVSELPVDGVLIVTPAYNRPTQEGLFRHYEAAASATRVPIIAYNVPSRTAVDMLPATVARIAQLSQVTYCPAGLFTSFRIVGKPEVILLPAIPVRFRSFQTRGLP